MRKLLIIIGSILMFCQAESQVKSRCPVCPPSLDGVPDGYVLRDSSGYARWQSVAGFDTAAIGVDSLSNLFWNLNGNAITDSNFIGSTNKKHVIFKQDNKFSGILDDDKIVFGVGSGEFAAGSSNSVFGSASFLSSTTGNRNTCVGQVVLENNNGDDNTAVGYFTQTIDTLTSKATIIGWSAAAGYNSTALGALSYAPDSNTIVLGDTATLIGVGIGTSYPNAKLHVVGSVKIVDGTQANGYVLTSDISGLASWNATTYTALDSATIYASTPTAGTVYRCTNCSANGLTGASIVSYLASAWRRIFN